MNKYAIQIFWSEEDAAFVAVCREFPGLSAFGETREEAAHEVQTALDLMIETYRGKRYFSVRTAVRFARRLTENSFKNLADVSQIMLVRKNPFDFFRR